jgi:hypothetical protein
MAKRISVSAAKKKVGEAMALLKSLEFGSRQRNELAGHVLLSLLDLKPGASWAEAMAPMRGITPIIEFIATEYGIKYAPNTRETIRDEAVKYFVESGMLIRNPDNPERPTNSGNTVYQIEPSALALARSYNTDVWAPQLLEYMASRSEIRRELERQRMVARIPVRLPSGETMTLSPGGQNPLIRAIIEKFCPTFTPGGTVVYVGDAENKFLHLDATYLEGLGVVIAPAAKMPDVVVHDNARNWLLLIEAVTSAGPVDGKRRKELKELFRGSKAGLVFVTAFTNRESFGKFQSQISWETEVWFAAEPDHILHYNGERFLGPYPDVLPSG